jgi:hypothetical protein
LRGQQRGFRRLLSTLPGERAALRVVRAADAGAVLEGGRLRGRLLFRLPGACAGVFVLRGSHALRAGPGRADLLRDLRP